MRRGPRSLAATAWLNSLCLDARFACRMLVRNRGATAVAVTSIALGIGVNLAVFNFVNAVFLSPVPGVPDSNALVTFQHRTRSTGNFTGASYADYEHYRRNARSFSDVIAWTGCRETIEAAGWTERVACELVSDNYFQVLNSPTTAGRLLQSSDWRLAAEPAVVLSDDYWRRHFGADATVVGRTLRIGRTMATIVGVAPRDFRGLSLRAEAPALWMPVVHKQPSLLTYWGSQSFTIAARLKPGTSLQRARAEVNALSFGLDAERAASGALRDLPEYQQLEAVVQPSRQARLSPAERTRLLEVLGVLGAVGVLVLLIAWFNVANLTIARAVAREHEMAIRCSLGGSWPRVLQMLVVEHLILAVVAAAAAVPAGFWMTRTLTAFGSDSPLAIVDRVQLDARIALVALLLAGVTAAFLSFTFGWLARRAFANGALGPGRRSVTASSGAHQALVAAQVGLSVTLLVGAGLFTRTLLNAIAVDVTTRPDRLLLARLDPRAAQYDDERGRRLYERLLSSVRDLPGVVDAAAVFVVPLAGRRGGTNVVWREGGAERTRQVGFNAVSVRHFPTVGVPIVIGRDFTDADGPGARPVAIVNEVLAERLLGGRSAVGQRLTIKGRPESIVEVVGVVRDGRFRSYRDEIEPTVYVPLSQRFVSPVTLEVRTSRNPLPIVPAVRRELAAIDSSLPLTAIGTARKHFGDALWRERLTATIVSGLAILAVALVGIGLYGVVSFTVARRTPEIGIRMALGAPASAVLKAVLGRLLGMVAVGTVAGYAAAVVLTRYVRAWLFGLSATDPLVYASVGLAVAGVCAMGTLLPARRALMVDPVAAIRAD